MSIKIIIVLILTFIMGLIGTLAYSVRSVGVKTGRIAISFLATICGALLMPSFIKVLSKVVGAFSIYKSIPKKVMLFNVFSIALIAVGVMA